MRSKDRIPEIMDCIQAIWSLQQDARFLQLMYIYEQEIQGDKEDCFYIEDDVFLDFLKQKLTQCVLNRIEKAESKRDSSIEIKYCNRFKEECDMYFEFREVENFYISKSGKLIIDGFRIHLEKIRGIKVI